MRACGGALSGPGCVCRGVCVSSTPPATPTDDGIGTLAHTRASIEVLGEARAARLRAAPPRAVSQAALSRRLELVHARINVRATRRASHRPARLRRSPARRSRRAGLGAALALARSRHTPHHAWRRPQITERLWRTALRACRRWRPRRPRATPRSCRSVARSSHHG